MNLSLQLLCMIAYTGQQTQCVMSMLGPAQCQANRCVSLRHHTNFRSHRRLTWLMPPGAAVLPFTLHSKQVPVSHWVHQTKNISGGKAEQNGNSRWNAIIHLWPHTAPHALLTCWWEISTPRIHFLCPAPYFFQSLLNFNTINTFKRSLHCLDFSSFLRRYSL